MKPSLLALIFTLLIVPAFGDDKDLTSDLVFDAKFYLQRWPDVDNFIHHDLVQARGHWLGSGMREGRESSPVFDVRYYMKHYPDVEAEVGKGNCVGAIKHWLTKGIAEGRQASETFDVKVYLEALRREKPGVNFSYADAIHHYMALPLEKRKPYLKVAPAAPVPVLDAGKVLGLKGKFYVDVDDLCVLFVNGAKVLKTGLGQAQSEEIELKPGDHIVAQLRNGGGPRHFKLLFIASDKQRMVNFPHQVFKILPDPETSDFKAADFPTYVHLAKQIKSERNPFPYKNQSEWMWGEMDISTLAALLSKEMFVPLRLQ